jgi:zinc/manganese transport system substrate-binding protein
MMLRPYRTLLLGAGALTLVVPACGDDDAESSGPTAERPTIVVTTSIWADITSNVACDGLAGVRTVIPNGGDPHAYEPSLQDREVLESASLVVANGLSLEESLDDTIEAAERSGTPVFRFADVIEPLPLADEDEHADEDDGEHGDQDPHLWFDPIRVADALPELGSALVEEAGLDAARVDECVERYRSQLADADAEITDVLRAVPVERRILVTNHEALGYFADRYDFEILGTVIPSSSTLAETSPAELQDLADEIEQIGLPAIFAETQHSTAEVDALAAALSDVAVVTLHTEALGPADSGADSYVGLVRTDAQLIADSLS